MDTVLTILAGFGLLAAGIFLSFGTILAALDGYFDGEFDSRQNDGYLGWRRAVYEFARIRGARRRATIRERQRGTR